jgi:hypothetical protein
MADRQLDAFILFNEREDAVVGIVDELEKRGVSTYFWRRDVLAGESTSAVENARLEEARTVVVFLGNSGWGPSHKSIAERARPTKRLIPVLIGNPPDAALNEIGGLFRDPRYVDLREPNEAAMALLVRSIQRADAPRPAGNPEFDAIMIAIRDGDESRRASTVQQIVESQDLDRKALSARLRTEIQVTFAPAAEADMPSSARDPKKVSAIRSWLLTCLIRTDPADEENRELILRHLSPSVEPDENVRFWVLAQLYWAKAEYVQQAAGMASSDYSSQVLTLGHAIVDERTPELIENFRSDLSRLTRDGLWGILRTLRIVAIPNLAGSLCELLMRGDAMEPTVYDTLYALSNQVMAAAASPILEKNPGLAASVDRVLGVARVSDPNAAWNFTILLAALPEEEIDRALDAAAAQNDTSDIAFTMRRLVARRRRANDADANVGIAGYTSEIIDVTRNRLDIMEDVQTLAAVMLAKDVKPPLAIGLFGDWGTGKSFFMESLEAATERLAQSRRRGFYSEIVSIRFNAWHYAETNLWASMVSHILEQLAAHVNPQLSPEEQQAELTKQLASAKAVHAQAEKEKERVEGLLRDRATELQDAKVAREKKELTLRDFKASDLRRLLDSDKALKSKLEKALGEMGIPAVLDSMANLTKVIAEAGSVRGRILSLATAVLQGKNRLATIALLLLVLAIPAIALAIDSNVAQHFFVRVGGVVAEVTAFVVGAKKLLGDGLTKVKANLSLIEEAKRKVDEEISKMRAKPTKEEEKIEKEISELKAKEKQTEARLSAAAQQVVELEKRMQTAQQGLMTFLAERAGSDDYRKHLSLISTIRRDFNSLGQHLEAASTGAQSRRVDRIVLYIDDLDRCPEEKVMEVLQAVHLLLAYPLFVVVVGVDPRWLLHSLRKKYRAFRKKSKSRQDETWQTTPQNYLEKIFQIPFTLRPMTEGGYQRLVGSLLLPDNAQPTAKAQPEEKAIGAVAASGLKGGPQITPTQTTPTGTASTSPATPAVVAQQAQQSQTTPQKPEEKFAIHEDALTIQPWEAEFAERLFELLPTPRAVKRFSNVYRILKAPMPVKSLGAFEGTAEAPGDFRLPMLLLAMLMGAPDESAEVFPAMWQAARGGRGAADILRDLAGLVKESSEELRVLAAKVRPVAAGHSFPATAKLMVYWLPRVARFSFDVVRGVELSNAAAKRAGENSAP